MRYTVALLALSLTGCYQSVNQNDIQTAITVCGSLEQVVEIRAALWGAENALCSDRTRTNLDRANWVKK